MPVEFVYIMYFTCVYIKPLGACNLLLCYPVVKFDVGVQCGTTMTVGCAIKGHTLVTNVVKM